MLLPRLGGTWPQALTMKVGQVSVEKGCGDLYDHNNHRSCASRDQRSHQISSCWDLNPITCRGQGKEFFFPEELQDWLNSSQGGLVRPGRITLLATAQEQGDAASGWMGLVGPLHCSLAEGVPSSREKLRASPTRDLALRGSRVVKCSKASLGDSTPQVGPPNTKSTLLWVLC